MNDNSMPNRSFSDSFFYSFSEELLYTVQGKKIFLNCLMNGVNIDLISDLVSRELKIDGNIEHDKNNNYKIYVKNNNRINKKRKMYFYNFEIKNLQVIKQ